MFRQLPRVTTAPYQDAALYVGVERPAGEVGATDQGDALVDDDELRVEGGAGRAVGSRPDEPPGR